MIIVTIQQIIQASADKYDSNFQKLFMLEKIIDHIALKNNFFQFLTKYIAASSKYFK